MVKWGIRTAAGSEKAGDILPNSWHPAGECEWVLEDTELDGTCAFELFDEDSPESIAAGLRAVRSFWPDSEAFVIVRGELGDAERDGGLPEDGAILIRRAEVVKMFRASR